MSGSWPRLACGALALALLLPVSARAQISDDKVKIGVLGDQVGFGSDLGGPGAAIAARMAAEDFGGTVLGKPIEIVVGDHFNKADAGAVVLRRWFDLEGVDAVTDLSFSSVALAAVEVATEKNRTLLITGGTSSDITGKRCSPVVTHWTDDTYSLSVGTARAIAASGGNSWYFVTTDAVFGISLQQDASRSLEQAGAKVLGSVRFPPGSSDFSSFLLQAQASGAKIIALASGGGDTINAIKQAAEFRITPKQTVTALLMYLTDVHAVGLDVAKGLYVTEGFYWNQNDATRAFAKRFIERHGKMPTKIQGQTYAAVMNYLNAVKQTGTDEAKAVNAKLRSMPIDYWGQKASIRRDGRVLYDLVLYQVKTPAESKAPWDYYNVVRPIPANEAFREPIAECALNK